MAAGGGSTRILAIASGGGHWVQLLRLRPAFAESDDVAYVTVDRSYRSDVGDSRFYVIPDATRWNPLGLVRLAATLLIILLRERPDVIISTGAAPGYFGLRLGRLLRCRTVWIDSMANVDRVSLSGQRVGRFADLWLTQWPDLAASHGPRFEGSVL